MALRLKPALNSAAELGRRRATSHFWTFKQLRGSESKMDV